MKLSRPLYLLWILIILGVSLTPGNQVPEINLPHLDKIGHTIFYAILALLGCEAFARPGRVWQAFAVSFVLAVLYGGLLELSQAAFVQGRSAEMADLFADAAGALAGAACWAFAKRKNRSPRAMG